MNQLALFITSYAFATIIISYWAFASVAFNRGLKNKFIWIALIIVFPPIGAIAYFQSRSKRTFSPKFNIQ